MLIRELLEAKPLSGRFDLEHYGVYRVEMSRVPIRMPSLTGDTAQYVAKVTDTRKNETWTAAGVSQAAARDAALAMALGDQERSQNPDDYQTISLDFNVEFGRMYYNPDSSPWYKVTRQGDNLILVRANRDYVRNFGEEIRELGFLLSGNRAPSQSSPQPILVLPKSLVRELDVEIGMRYKVEEIEADSDGNDQFVLTPISRVQKFKQAERYDFPSVTVSGALRKDLA